MRDRLVGHQRADHAARRRVGRGGGVGVQRGAGGVEQREATAVVGLLAGVAAGHAREVRGADPDQRRVLAHRRVGDAGREAGVVDPARDLGGGPVDGGDDEVRAGDRVRDRLRASQPARDADERRARVELGEAVRGGLDLRPAEVVLAVEHLPREVGQLDVVVVDADDRADAAHREHRRRHPAEAAEAEHGDRRLLQPPLRGRPRDPRRGEVAEVAQLAVVALQAGGVEVPRVVVGVLDEALGGEHLDGLVEIRPRQLGRRARAEGVQDLLVRARAVRPLQQAAEHRDVAVEHDIAVRASAAVQDDPRAVEDDLDGGLQPGPPATRVAGRPRLSKDQARGPVPAATGSGRDRDRRN